MKKRVTLSLKKHPSLVPSLVQVGSLVLAAKEAKAGPHAHSQKRLPLRNKPSAVVGSRKTLLSFSKDEKTETQRSELIQGHVAIKI